jgi:hypothetical protein
LEDQQPEHHGVSVFCFAFQVGVLAVLLGAMVTVKVILQVTQCMSKSNKMIVK